MKKAAVILAGGFSKRFGQDKCLVELAGKPLVQHVIDRIFTVVVEKVVVVGSNEQKEKFARLLKSEANVAVDKYDGQSPLVGALTGFESVSADYSLLLPCDTPFVSSDIGSLLFDLCESRSAAIPRWPNGYIEPLQAVYHTKSAIKAAQQALNAGKRDLFSMINNLSGVRYVSTLVLRQLDCELLTFFNINMQESLRRAESILKKGK